jgi:hypothetical protein
MFLRRKPNPEKLLHGLRDIAHDLAQQMYDLSLVNPPRTIAEINETAMRIFDDIVSGYTDHSSAAIVSGVMLAAFREKCIELAGHANG